MLESDFFFFIFMNHLLVKTRRVLNTLQKLLLYICTQKHYKALQKLKMFKEYI